MVFHSSYVDFCLVGVKLSLAVLDLMDNRLHFMILVLTVSESDLMLGGNEIRLKSLLINEIRSKRYLIE